MTKKKTIKVLYDKVLVELIQEDKTTESGILIPSFAKSVSKKAKVISHGFGINGEPLTVSVGDTVILGNHTGAEIKIDNKDYLIIKESDILAIL